MSIQVENEQATAEEATGILLERLPASKVARLLAAWRVGQGDYLAGREKLFAGETVDSLFDKAKAANGGKCSNPFKVARASRLPHCGRRSVEKGNGREVERVCGEGRRSVCESVRAAGI